MIERINIQNASRKIGLSDTRSFQKWCNRNGVIILCDPGCKKHYVLKSDFENAADKIIKDQIENKGKLSTEEIKARMKFTSEYMTAVNEIEKNKTENSKYKLSGEHSNKILARLLNIIEHNIIPSNGKTTDTVRKK